MKYQALNHPKMHEFASSLQMPIYAAIGLMESLWQWAAVYAPSGNLVTVSNEAIARAVGWDGDANTLVDSMKYAEFLDGGEDCQPLTIHDWSEHATDQVHVTLAIRGEKFADGTKPTPRRASQSQRLKIAKKQGKKMVISSAQSRQSVGTSSAQSRPSPSTSPSTTPSPSTSPDKEAATPLAFPAGIDTPKFREAWTRWTEYRKAAKLKRLQPASVTGQLAKCAEWGEAAAIQSIDDSIRNGWQGLFEPKARGGGARLAPTDRRALKAAGEFEEEIIMPIFNPRLVREAAQK